MNTALQELIEWLDNSTVIQDEFDRHIIVDKATELLEKEREQIENAWLNGVGAWDSEMEAEQYYNETFKR